MKSIFDISEIADFNNDGRSDIAISSLVLRKDTITIFLGTNEGSFIKNFQIDTGGVNYCIITDDFNNDGNIDLCVNSFLYFGDGQGGFGEQIYHGVILSTGISGDFNNDEISDIITISTGDGYRVINVYLGNGDGTFQTPISETHLNKYNIFPKAGDFNSDGNLDVVLQYICLCNENQSACKCLRTEGPIYNDNILILFGKGDGTFQDSTLVMTQMAYPGFISSFSISDVNNDNNIDFLFTNYLGSKMFLGDGDGSYSLKWEGTWQKDSNSFIIDADNDGLKDIFSLGVNENSNNFSFMKGNGDGTFGEESFGTTNGFEYPDNLIVVDLNGDYKEDFISTVSDTLAVFLNEGVTSEVSEREILTQSPFAISQNFPNPFNPSTTLTYSLATPVHVTLSVYNSAGQKVATLVDSYMSAGEHSTVFDGKGLVSGIYFYRLESEGFEKSGRMTLVK
ncbi:T9SS type A sorting domain-containing protein [Candidatus Latescibacterota bacterium]